MKIMFTFIILYVHLLEINAQEQIHPVCDSANYLTLRRATEAVGRLNLEGDDDEWYGFPWHVGGLRQDSLFAIVFNGPKLYSDCYTQFLNDRTIGEKQKHFALISMQKLPYDLYCKVLKSTYLSYKNRLVNYRTLGTAIDQDGIWNNTVLRNANRKELNSILNKIEKDKMMPTSIRKEVRQLLSRFSERRSKP